MSPPVDQTSATPTTPSDGSTDRVSINEDSITIRVPGDVTVSILGPADDPGSESSTERRQFQLAFGDLKTVGTVSEDGTFVKAATEFKGNHKGLPYHPRWPLEEFSGQRAAAYKLAGFAAQCGSTKIDSGLSEGESVLREQWPVYFTAKGSKGHIEFLKNSIKIHGVEEPTEDVLSRLLSSLQG